MDIIAIAVPAELFDAVFGPPETVQDAPQTVAPIPDAEPTVSNTVNIMHASSCESSCLAASVPSGPILGPDFAARTETDAQAIYQWLKDTVPCGTFYKLEKLFRN
jgi:hypothetical protein